MPMLTFNLSPRRGFTHKIGESEDRRTLAYNSTLKYQLTVKAYGGEVLLESGNVIVKEKKDTDGFGTISYVPKFTYYDEYDDRVESESCYQVETFIAPSTFEYLLHLDEDAYYVQVSMEFCPAPGGAIQYGGMECIHHEIEWLVADKLDVSQHENATETTIYIASKACKN